MSEKLLVEYISIFELFVCLLTLAMMVRKKVLSNFRTLALFIGLRCGYGAMSIALLFFRRYTGVSKVLAYNIYALTYWPCFVLQAVLMVVVVYNIYDLALQPFAPLRKLGNIIFRWVAAISVAVSLGTALSPDAAGSSYWIKVLAQMQQTASVLTICLLLFVCFALRPLGLTFKSRAFGASLGLGFMSVTQLVQSAWFHAPQSHAMYSMLNFYSGVGFSVALLVWFVYVVLPEPQRRLILLPTTSPYFFWNKISEALGDSPGYVAVGGFTPEDMAPAELHALLATEDQQRPEPGPRRLQPIAVNQ